MRSNATIKLRWGGESECTVNNDNDNEDKVDDNGGESENEEEWGEEKQQSWP